MKKILLSFLVFSFCFVSFSFASLFPDLETSIEGTDSSYFSACNKYGCQWTNPPFKTFRCSGNGSLSINYNVSDYNGLNKSLSCPGSFDIDGVVGINHIYRENSQSDFIIYVNSSATPSGYFSPLLSGLITSINEFIPYVVYISIAVLIATLGFVAVRWFINWLKGKVLSPFK